MSLELNVRFTSSDRFAIKSDDRKTDALEFNPINDGDRDDIRWYLESYATQYMTNVDDRSADRIAAQFGFSFAETPSVDRDVPDSFHGLGSWKNWRSLNKHNSFVTYIPTSSSPRPQVHSYTSREGLV
jgi:hypothetical protein